MKTPMGKPVAKGKGVTKSVPAPKAVYKQRLAKPEPDNFPARPKPSMSRVKRLKNQAL